MQGINSHAKQCLKKTVRCWLLYLIISMEIGWIKFLLQKVLWWLTFSHKCLIIKLAYFSFKCCIGKKREDTESFINEGVYQVEKLKEEGWITNINYDDEVQNVVSSFYWYKGLGIWWKDRINKFFKIKHFHLVVVHKFLCDFVLWNLNGNLLKYQLQYCFKWCFDNISDNNCQVNYPFLSASVNTNFQAPLKYKNKVATFDFFSF